MWALCVLFIDMTSGPGCDGGGGGVQGTLARPSSLTTHADSFINTAHLKLLAALLAGQQVACRPVQLMEAVGQEHSRVCDCCVCAGPPARPHDLLKRQAAVVCALDTSA